MTPETQLPEPAAENQSRFRALNERIQAHNQVHHWVDPPMPDWVCECAYETCSAPVQLTVAEYESVRTDATRFLVAPSDDHVLPEIERVVERNDRYWVVEKLGQAADMSEALDLRARDVAADAEVVSHADRVAWNLPQPRR
jgi:hypothetical protein